MFWRGEQLPSFVRNSTTILAIRIILVHCNSASSHKNAAHSRLDMRS